MPELIFRVVLQDDGVTKKLVAIRDEAEKARLKIEDPASLVVVSEGADGKLKAVQAQAEKIGEAIEKPAEVKISAEQSLATLRDLSVILQGVIAAFSGLTRGMNDFLDAALTQSQAQILANQAFGEGADEMARYASEMQRVTNFGDEEMLVMMAKMAATYKLSNDEIQQLTPVILDFAEANKASGMSMESAFDLMGRALNGHTEMLGRHGIQLDDNRLKMEGVSYLVEKLGGDYGGTATALADLRLQNANTWGDIKEEIGSFLSQVIAPILSGMKFLMQAWQGLPPVLKGVTAGLALAVPVVIAFATAITTATAAITALKAAINPVAAILSMVVGGLTAGAVAAGAYAATTATVNSASDDLATSQANVAATIAEARTEVEQEAEKFEILSSRLLELRSKTSLATAEKREMGNVIRSLNSGYGEYLGNIDLEKSSYNDLASAISAASEALVGKKIAEVYGQKYDQQLSKVANLKVEVDGLKSDYDAAIKRRNELMSTLPQNYDYIVSDANPMGFNPSAWFGNNDEWGKLEARINKFGALTGRLESARQDLTKLGNAYRQAMLELPDLLSFSPGSGSDGGGGKSAADSQKDAAQRLIDELAAMRLSESQRLETEYQRRLKIIQDYTADGSAEEKTAIDNLNAWKDAKDKELLAKEKEGMQAKFRAEIDYYASLDALGVSSWEARKKVMEEYYEWAKANLSKEEADLVLAQMQESNLRYGQAQKEKEDKEREHQRTLVDIRRGYSDRNLSELQQDLNNSLIKLQRHYDDKKALMIEAGLTEAQITELFAQEKARLVERSQEQIIQANERQVLTAGRGMSQIFGQIAGMQEKESRRGFKMWKTMAIAQGYVDTFSAAIGAYRAMVAIPAVGPGLAVAAAASAMAAGLANIQNISNQEYVPPKAATGGMIHGPSHQAGGTIIEAEGGEYIIAENRVKAFGKGIFDFLNFAPLELVKRLVGSMNIPMPELATDGGGSYSFAGGGQVGGSNAALAIFTEIRDILKTKNVSFTINVDPLSSNPVKVSEIAERGDLIRSGY